MAIKNRSLALKLKAGKLRPSTYYPVGAIIAVWVVMELLVNPRGNFPLNDDWCYAKTVYALVRTGRLEFIQIVPMTLLTQVLWGALFCKLFGVSFFALRLSTMALSLVGLLATYGLLREVQASRKIAFIGCMVVAVNPIYVNLSNTFMTDVPFYAFALLTLYLFARALNRDSNPALAAGTLLACATTLTRQAGVVLPIAFSLAYLLKNGISRRAAIRALTPPAITLGALTGYQQWLTVTDRLPAYSRLMTQEAFSFLSRGLGPITVSLAQILLVVLVYLGLFLLPFLVLLGRRSVSLVSVGSFAVLTGAVILTHRWMPLNTQPGDIIVNFGVGPLTLRDVFLDKLPHWPSAPMWFWIMVTLAGAAGGGILVRHLFLAVKSLLSLKAKRYTYGQALTMLLIVTFAALFCQSVVLSGLAYFDRYFLLLVPISMMLVLLNGDAVARHGRGVLGLAAAILLLYGIFSAAATHDYFSWNRARLDALYDLTNMQVPTDRIDGGYEFNGWFNYKDDPDQNWWRVVGDDYTLTFGPLPNFEVLRTYPFRRWLPPGEGEVLVLRRM